MKRRSSWLLFLGVLLIGGSVVLLLVSQWYGGHTAKKAKGVAAEIAQRLPSRTAGVPGEIPDPQMPVLELDGKDYVCLLDVPAFGVTLPVQMNWSQWELLQTPCRFWGSSYDGTLILGGSSGQFDFCGKLDLGHRIIITDMQGREFSYEVCHIERSGNAQYERLAHSDYPLTLFVKEAYANRYILVRCGYI